MESWHLKLSCFYYPLLIILNNSQSSKEIFMPKGVTSGACLRANTSRNAEGRR